MNTRTNLKNSVLSIIGEQETYCFDPYSDLYLVSNYGNIKNSITGKVLKPSTNRSGYQIVKIYNNKTKNSVAVHRLVARTFLGSCLEFEVNHINGNKKDNSLINLEWVTRLENLKHAKDTGLYLCRKGEESPSCKFFKADVRKMVELQKLGYKLKDIAKIYNTSITYVCTLIRRVK